MSAPGDSKPRIVVGVDGSPSSLAALRWAVCQAELTGAVLEAVIAWQFPAAAAGYSWSPGAITDIASFEEISAKTLAAAISDVVDPASSVQVVRKVREGNTAQVLLDAAAGADLLVVGSRGHGGFAGALLGSVSQHCVHHAACPVAIIHDGKRAAAGEGGPR